MPSSNSGHSISESAFRTYKRLQTGIYVRVRRNEAVNRPTQGYLEGLNWHQGTAIVRVGENGDRIYPSIRDVLPEIPEVGDRVVLLNGDHRGEQAMVEAVDHGWEVAKLVTMDGETFTRMIYQFIGVLEYAGCRRPIVCSNVDCHALPSQLDKVFRRYGEVKKISMKYGCTYVWMSYMKDAKEAISRLDGSEFQGRRIHLAWGEEENAKAKKTLFVTNFDAQHTSKKDLEKHFERFGKIVSVTVVKKFAFIQFGSEADASFAVDQKQYSNLLGKQLIVEFAKRDTHTKRHREEDDSSPPTQRKQKQRRT